MNSRNPYAFIFVFFFCLSSVHALAQINSFHVDSDYSDGESLRGSLNVSLINVPSDARFKSNLGGEIVLEDFLNAQKSIPGIDYICSTPGCKASYELSNKSYAASENTLYGLVLTGKVSNIKLETMEALSSDRSSCYPSFFLDVLDTRAFSLVSNTYINQKCGPARQGCFTPNLDNASYQKIDISQGEYCQKMLLPTAPAFTIGARVSGTGPLSLSMSLHDSSGKLVKSCVAGANASCIVPFANAVPAYYFVCAKAIGNSNYTIRSEHRDSCGTSGQWNNLTADYDLFAQPLAFGASRLDLNNASFYDVTGKNINVALNDYITSTYHNECDPYCIIPFRIYGTSSAQISHVRLLYTRDGQEVVQTNVHSIVKNPGLITSQSLTLNLGYSNFTAVTTNEKYLRLYIDNSVIVRTPIKVSPAFSFSISPLFAALGSETKFMLTSNANVSRVIWKFGDGSVGESSTREITHSYTQPGNYFVLVEAFRPDGMSSVKNYTVLVGDPKETVVELLKDYSERLDKIDMRLMQYPSWIQKSLEEGIGIEALRSTLAQVRSDQARIVNPNDYSKLANTLLTLQIPKDIESEQSSKALILGIERMDPSHIEQISNKTYDELELKNSILIWMNRNYRPDASIEHINAVYSDHVETLLSHVAIETKPLAPLNSENYLIINQAPDSVIFPDDQAHFHEDAVYYVLDRGDQIFEFAVKDQVSVEDLGAYITPSVDELISLAASYSMCDFDSVCDSNLGETFKTCSDCRNTKNLKTITYTILFFLVLGGIVWVYTRYEHNSGGRKVY